MTSQSILKHFLTEGDKLILSSVSPLSDQGGYAIAVNYGQSLVRLYRAITLIIVQVPSSLASSFNPSKKSPAFSFLEHSARPPKLSSPLVINWSRPAMHSALCSPYKYPPPWSFLYLGRPTSQFCCRFFCQRSIFTPVHLKYLKPGSGISQSWRSTGDWRHSFPV